MTARILFVDEEPEFLRAHIDTLEEAGYRIQHANSYTEALAALEWREFDLIILDLILPPDDDQAGEPQELSEEVGLRLHRVIREQLGKTRIPIIFFTVLGEMDTRQQIQRLESKYGQKSTILVKPKLPSQLLVQVRNLIGNSHDEKYP